MQSGQTLARVMGSGDASTSAGAGTRRGGRVGARAGSAPHARGVDAADGEEVSRVMGLEEVLGRTGGRTGTLGGLAGPGAAAGGRSKTLLEELTATLDVDSKLQHASIAGHGQIRFG